ncbi:MAG: caspase family protein, partial [Mariniphaga sp.]
CKTNKIYPSDIFYKYASIIKPSTGIYSKYNNIERIATTRLGMEYKIVEEKGFLYKIELPSGESGWIDKSNVETFYSIERKPDIKQAIQSYVEQEVAEWQKQGEFELPENYLKRMEKRQEKIDELVDEAVLMYQQDYKELFEWEKSTISNYNPNNQIFRVTVPQLGEFDIHVPVEYAPEFKTKWSEKTISNQKFLLVDGNWELASMDIKVSDVEYIATYNSQVESFYNQSTQFNISFDPVEISLSERKVGERHQNAELQELSYNVSSNLPVTNFSNPDAIAVIIGNAYYQHTNPVKYAINDAQLMKNYLVNVLGYREGNVFFERNITKGTFENYFGTKDNPEGKLAGLIKEGKSDVFIYYSGHGFPDGEGNAYFLPGDAEPNLVQLGGYSISTFYQNLAQLKAKSVTIVLDACFSGYGIDRNVSNAFRIVKDVKQVIPNGAVLTSSKADEESTWLDQQQHGLFTYFFLRAIHDKMVADINRDNKLTIKEIYEYVSDKTEGVPYYARRLHNIEQNPEAAGDIDRVLVEY